MNLALGYIVLGVGCIIISAGYLFGYIVSPGIGFLVAGLGYGMVGLSYIKELKQRED